MNKLLACLLCFLLPRLALADSSLSFAPPPSDYSVIFLGNLFGIVDGVLHGTGSQIMGIMFGVFNSAVLALGGMIIMYTLMVSTMNTAHEGQMLGQKWSSMWIPVRSTIGLALLIPKASGYCLMQIFVMWIVVQGVGAADKVWEAALSYLNRGGVIIQAQSNPSDALVAPFMNTPAVPTGAMTMLTGQVCMLGMQKQLENQRQSYLDAQQKGAGPCSGGNNQSTDPMSTFCKTAVPDFLSTVNAVTQQNNNKYGNTFSVLMPNFDNSSPFAVLNGMCGTITWNSLNSQLNIATPTRGQNKQAVTGSGSAPVGGITLTTPELETAQLSRAIAVQQMYMDLSTIAQIIINNDPLMSASTNNNSTTQPFSPTATQQFGVPYTANGSICTSYDKNCLSWGSDTSASGNGGGALFNGTEFLGAISDYNGIMTPTLNLIRQSADAQNNNDARKFIADANSSGWIMAGSYFFDLIALNGNAVTNSKLQDTNSGLDASKYTDNLSTPCANYPILCTWFNIKNASATTAIPALASIQNNLIGTSPPNLKADAKRPIVAGTSSSTVYGFINNSIMVQLPGQPGIAPLKFANLISFNVDSSVYRLSHADFDCGKVKIVFFSFCLGEMMGDLFYNYIFRYVYNFLLDLFGTFINQVVMAFIMIPLQGMSEIFQQGLKIIATPGVNPVVALAKMGAMYINFSGNLWLMLLNMAVTSALIPIFGIFIFALMSLAMPLILAWVGVMVTVGFTTSYYVPILPYMIFTFGSIAWLISVIEAMVAAPIVALGVTHPEGHDAFGKGEAAIMILMNVFLRPAMMIIGYISGIALCYVGVWILNAGFDHAISFIQGGPTQAHAAPGDLIDHIKGGYGFSGASSSAPSGPWNDNNSAFDYGGTDASGSGSGGYKDWAGVYAFFFSILIYTSMYLVIVQKAFTLISYLPDKVLRWIGGSPESLGQESSQWGDEVKQKSGEAAKGTQDAQGQISKQLGGIGQKQMNDMKSKGGGEGDVSAEASKPPDDPGGGGGGAAAGGGEGVAGLAAEGAAAG